MKNFFRSIWGGMRNIGHKINRGFNTVKHFVRTNYHRVRETAGMVREAMKYFDALPYIGDAAKVIGGVASGVDRGVEMVNRGINRMEEWQKYAGLPVQNEQRVNPLYGQQQVVVA